MENNKEDFIEKLIDDDENNYGPKTKLVFEIEAKLEKLEKILMATFLEKQKVLFKTYRERIWDFMEAREDDLLEDVFKVISQ